MAELLALIGGSWRALWLYPGGLALLVALVALHRVWPLGQPWQRTAAPLALLQLGGAWLVAALLPWPHTYWAYPLDLGAALLLLEAPWWLRRHHDWRVATRRLAVLAELTAALRVYPLVALAAALCGASAGSLIIVKVQGGAPLLRWLGVALWAVALPPLLALGPWQSAPPDPANSLRRVVHLALLATLALPGGDGVSYWAGAAAALIVAASFAALARWWRGPAARWERWQPALALLAVAALCWSAAAALLAQLR